MLDNKYMNYEEIRCINTLYVERIDGKRLTKRQKELFIRYYPSRSNITCEVCHGEDPQCYGDFYDMRFDFNYAVPCKNENNKIDTWGTNGEFIEVSYIDRTKYMIIRFEYEGKNPPLKWLESLIKKHPDLVIFLKYHIENIDTDDRLSSGIVGRDTKGKVFYNNEIDACFHFCTMCRKQDLSLLIGKVYKYGDDYEILCKECYDKYGTKN